jgi:hypothetical protein
MPLHYVIKFVSDMQQIGGILLFPPPIKLTATNWNIVKQLKHNNPNPYIITTTVWEFDSLPWQLSVSMWKKTDLHNITEILNDH